MQRQSCLLREKETGEQRLHPEAAVMLQAVWLDTGPNEPGRLLLLIHHLAIDGVSWRILLPDLMAAWQAVRSGQQPVLTARGTSFQRWAQHLATEALTSKRIGELPLWTAILSQPDSLLSTRPLDPQRDTTSTTRHLKLTLPTFVTAPLLGSVPALFHGQVNDVLLTAFSLALVDWRRRHRRDDSSAVLVDLESHGRQEAAGLDLSRTIGWFTSLFPVRLDPGLTNLEAGTPDLGRALKRIKEQLRALPDNGLGYGLLRYLNPQTREVLAGLTSPQVCFNYLGRFAMLEGKDWSLTPETRGLGVGDPAMPLAHALTLNTLTRDLTEGPELIAHWSWAGELFSETEIRDLAELWFEMLQTLVTEAQRPQARGFTPSDLPLITLDQSEIEQLEALAVLLPLRSHGSRPPLFCLHPAGGLSWPYAGLLRHLPSEQPLYGLQNRNFTHFDWSPSTIDMMAADYLQEIQAVQPKGPYYLLGWSLGAFLAHAIATQLQDQYESVPLLVLLDDYPPTQDVHLAERTDQDIFTILIRTLLDEPDELDHELVSVSSFKERLRQANHPMASLDGSIVQAIVRQFRAASHLRKNFLPRPFHGDLLFFRATLSAKESLGQSIEAWNPYIRGRIQAYDIACLHEKMMHPEPLARIGPILAAALDVTLPITPSSTKETIT